MKFTFLLCCRPVLEDEEKKSAKKKCSRKKGKERRKAQAASASENLYLTNDCAEEPISTNGCAEVPVSTNGCAQEPVSIIGCAEEPVSSPTIDLAEDSVLAITCENVLDLSEDPILIIDGKEGIFSTIKSARYQVSTSTTNYPEEPVITNDCAEEPVFNTNCTKDTVSTLSIDCTQDPVLIIDSLEQPVLTTDIPEEPVLTIDSPEESLLTIDSPEEPVLTIDSPEEPVLTTDSPEEHILTTDIPEEPVPTIDSPEEHVLITDSSEEPVPTIYSPEEPVLTIDSPEEHVLTTDIPGEPVMTINSPEESLLTIDSPEEPVLTIDSPEEPVLTTDSPEEHVLTTNIFEEPVPTIDSPEEHVLTTDSPEEHVLTTDIPEEPVPTIDSPEEPVLTTASPEESVLTIYSPEEPVLTIYRPEEPVTTINSPEESLLTIDSPEEPVLTIDSPEEPVKTTDIPEEPVLTINSPEETVPTIGSPEEQACVDQEAKIKKKWFLMKGRKGMKVSPSPAEKKTLTVDATEKKEKIKKNCYKKGKKWMKPTSMSAASLPVTCSEGPDLTISCAEQPALPIAFGDISAAIAIGSVQKCAVPIDCTVYCAEQQRLEFQGFKKLQEEQSGQGETQKSRRNHTVLGFPNIGNTCYMNATLQSLFSLQTFILDIRREESCWGPDLTPHLQKCLADLYLARASSSREQKIQLLETLKRTIAAEFGDFNGDEQQDAQEFLGVLLCQLKEEAASLRTRMGLRPSACPVGENFEFDMLSTRTCLRCGAKVCRTESYNSLFVDLVPGGTVQDCLALYFKASEVECQCQCCPGQWASVEQMFQSVPRVLVVQLKRFSWNARGNLVKMHDQLRICPRVHLQAHSRADVHLPTMPRPKLTRGDCTYTSPSPGGAVPLPADKKSSVERSPGKRADQDSYSVDEYRITSVVSHIGPNRQRGHYICESMGYNTTWLSFDDERVKKLDQKSVLKRRAHSAYLLFYEYRGAAGLR